MAEKLVELVGVNAFFFGGEEMFFGESAELLLEIDPGKEKIGAWVSNVELDGKLQVFFGELILFELELGLSE